MTEAQFNQIVDDLMFSIEESIDDSGADLDYENTAGMLTITCEANGSQIILSRQPTLSLITIFQRNLMLKKERLRLFMSIKPTEPN